MMTTQDMLCWMIRNMSANELSYFLMWSSSVSIANQGTDECYMNESCLKTRVRCANTSETNECRFTRLPIDSDLLLYLALFLRCHVIILLRAVCMRGGGAGAGEIID